MTKRMALRLVRRVAIALAVITSSLFATLPPHSGAAAHVVRPGFSPPRTGAWFGATASVGKHQDPGTFGSLQRSVGRRLDIDRDYSDFGVAQPSRQVRWDVYHHVIPLLSIDPVTSTGRDIPWSSIADGSHDAAIVAQARALGKLRSPVLLSFDHEPELHAATGTAPKFVAAWRHYVTVFRGHGANNVHFVLILLAGTYGNHTAARWYPGNKYVDWVGADGYNSFGCFGGHHNWRTFHWLFSGFNAFAVAHHRPAAVAEWGSTVDPRHPDRKAQWIAAASKTIRSWPDVKLASYFDGSGQTAACHWPLTSSAAAMSAYAHMAALPYFNARPVAGMTISRATGPAPLTVTFDASRSHGVLHAISSWSLNFGDGSGAASGTGAPPAALKHRYKRGSYLAKLEVVDRTGQYQVRSLRIAAGTS